MKAIHWYANENAQDDKMACGLSLQEKRGLSWVLIPKGITCGNCQRSHKAALKRLRKKGMDV